MSSPCLSGGGRAYRLDLEIIKSPASSWISNSSSPSSTLSESSNSPLAISTRKPRTPRKRPNQTYNEAAAILSTAYPKIFPAKSLTKPSKFTKSIDVKNTGSSSSSSSRAFLLEPSELLTPFRIIHDSAGFLFGTALPDVPNFRTAPKSVSLFEKPCRSPGEITSDGGNCSEICDEDFDAESILDEEVEEGIDSIMGNLNMDSESGNDSNHARINSTFCYGYPIGLGFDYGFGMRRELRAMRNVDEGSDWWRFPSVNVVDVSPKPAKSPAEKKKKNRVEIKNSENATHNSARKAAAAAANGDEESPPQPNAAAGLLLKLNYDGVLDAWSDKASPFSGDSPLSESAGSDLQVRLAQVDLFSENGGVREASVLRYKEKRRTRFFSKKIRYQVRKVNADQRPRMKGRFVRTPDDSPEDD